jgi:hypothetical protein
MINFSKLGEHKPVRLPKTALEPTAETLAELKQGDYLKLQVVYKGICGSPHCNKVHEVIETFWVMYQDKVDNLIAAQVTQDMVYTELHKIMDGMVLGFDADKILGILKA